MSGIRSIGNIRIGTRADLPPVIEMMKEAYDFYYRDKGLPSYRDDYLQRFYLDHVIRPTMQAFLYVLDEEICGIMLVRKDPLAFGPVYCAKDSLWWIKKSARSYKVAAAMLAAYEDWYKAVGCDFAVLAHMMDVRVESLYKRFGFQAVETHCMKVV